MNHIDEGTIHAWLDGALSEERAREVESHVATCGECSAAVAEARGLIAGASRILTALDDVPANVTPKRAPSRAPQPRRQWRAAPWVTGIAAALMLAVGISTLNRTESPVATSETVGLQMDSAVPAAAPVVAEAERAVAAPPASTGSARDARASANTAVAQRGEQGEQGMQVAPRGRVAGGAGAAGERRDAREAKARDQSASPSEQSTIATGPVVLERPRLLSAAPDSGDRRRVAAAVAPGSDTRLRDAALAPDTSRARSVARASISADTTRLRTSAPRAVALDEVVAIAKSAPADSSAAILAIAGCYRLASAAEERPSSKSVTQRVTEGAAAARRARPAAPAPSARSDFAAQRPAVVRLDTTRAGALFRVTDPNASSYLGTWQRFGDSVRVELFLHGDFTIAVKDSVTCPQR